MKIIFNINTSVNGLRGQNRIYGKFDSKKAAIKALRCSLYHFNEYAHIGALGTIGKILVELYPSNTLIAVNDSHYIDPEKPFSYWVQETLGKWVRKIHRKEGGLG